MVSHRPQRIENNPPPGTLGYYFYSCPQEIRDQIFAFVLVRPPKWDIKHKQSCDLWKNIPAGCFSQPYTLPEAIGTCAHNYVTTASWRRRNGEELPIYVDPWRSIWAPPRTNPYLCTQCWDSQHRLLPTPVTHSLPCLCARRGHSQTLLVCKRWYEEAGRVFYARNVLSFSHISEVSSCFRVLTICIYLDSSRVTLHGAWVLPQR